MSGSIVPPIFVVTASEVLVFSDVASAARYMEPIDIANGEYESVYDSGGRRLNPTVARNTSSRWSPGPTEVSSLMVDGGENRPIELATALRTFLERLGHERATLDQDPLEKLVTKAVAAAGYTA